MCSRCNSPRAFEQEIIMTLKHSTQRIFVGAVVLCGVFSLMIASCSTTEQSSGLQARGTRSAGLADPPGSQGDPAPSAADVENGRQLFASSGCAGCHTVNGKGGLAGPDLSNEAGKGRTRDWLAAKIHNPKADDPQTIMPAVTTLSERQISNLVDYLLSLTPAGGQTAPAAAGTTAGQPAAAMAASPSVAAGGATWSQRCGQCHNLRPPSEYSDAQWAVAVQHMRVRVPLTGKEQRDVLAFLQASN
jgi:mono/diheme cytochrome c family protein